MKKSQTETQKVTNSLRFKTSSAIGSNMIYVSIRLDDECKNGHQDFAITGDVYKAGRPKTDSNYLMGGCIHEEILKAFPQFKIFVDLHLCDYKGIPMHCSANGFYNLTNGFNNTKPENANFKAKFCEEYRVTPEQFDSLNTTKNEVQFALMLEDLKIFEQWEQQANEAIKILEELTGNKFLIDSKKTQYQWTKK